MEEEERKRRKDVLNRWKGKWKGQGNVEDEEHWIRECECRKENMMKNKENDKSRRGKCENRRDERENRRDE